MRMKVLVTGGSGFLGRRTAAYLQQLGWQVLLPRHGELDITTEAELHAWFRRNRPDAVIHTAAVSDTGRCQREPEWSEKINVGGSVNLAKACREYGAKLLICSSDQVYSGSEEKGPHREDEILAPNNVYGCQKLRAEQRCLEILPETVCLRLSWMYAKTSLPNEHSHFLATLQGALADESKPLLWPIYDRRGITDVADVIKNLPKALELSGGVWNFGSENDSSTYDTVKTVLQELRMDAALLRLQKNEEAFAAQPRDLTMDLRRLNAAGIFFSTTKEALCTALSAEEK